MLLAFDPRAEPAMPIRSRTIVPAHGSAARMILPETHERLVPPKPAADGAAGQAAP
jgi:hypothetical protein